MARQMERVRMLGTRVAGLGPTEGHPGLSTPQGSWLARRCPSRAGWSGSWLRVRGTTWPWGPPWVWRGDMGSQAVVSPGPLHGADGWQEGRPCCVCAFGSDGGYKAETPEQTSSVQVKVGYRTWWLHRHPPPRPWGEGQMGGNFQFRGGVKCGSRGCQHWV